MGAAQTVYKIGHDRFGREARLIADDNGGQIEWTLHVEPLDQRDEMQAVRSLSTAQLEQISDVLHQHLSKTLPPYSQLYARVAKLEAWAHEPFDFSDLIRRIERLENVTAGLVQETSLHAHKLGNCKP
jgi:hypothetical protein